MMKPWDKEAMLKLLEARGITDPRVLQAFASVPRELFVPADFRDEAWIDAALPIECQQTISQPYVVAYMTERLQVSPEHDVLEIGTGSGYQAAILSQLARHVYTIERHEKLHRIAVARFHRLGLENVTAIVGDGMQGWPEPRRFDRIIVTAAAPELPQPLVGQLAVGGLMIVPVGGRKMQRLMHVTRLAGKIETQELLPVRFVPLLPDGGGES